MHQRNAQILVGGRRIDAGAYRIETPGGWTHVKPRSMAVLEYLARHPGIVCSRREIMEAVWGEAEVSEEVLSQAVRELRAAFNDDARNPTVIETIPRGGYRLIAQVKSGAGRRRRIPWLVAAVLLAIGTVVAGSWLITYEFRTSDRTVVAVLPFQYPQRGLAHIADGIVDEITSRLVESPAVAVVARTSAFTFRDSGADIPAIAEALNADRIIEGSVYREDDQLRIHVQLVNADGLHEWARIFSETDNGLLPLFTRVGSIVVGRFTASSGPSASRPGETGRSSEISEAAFRAYLKAEHLRRTDPRSARLHFPDKTLALYREAILQAPEFAQARAGLAHALFRQGASPVRRHESPERAEDLLAESRQAAARALELDPGNARALSVLAQLANRAWDWVAADEYFEKALEANPGHAEIQGLYARYLYRAGYTRAALELSRRALRLDPLSPFASHMVAHGLAVQGDMKRARHYLELTRELQGSWPAVLTSHLLISEERYKEVAEVLQEAGWADHAWRERWLNAALAAMEGTGSVDEAVRLLAEAEAAGELEPITGTIVHAYLGETEKSLDFLARVGPFNAMWQEQFEPVRTHPRFVEIMEARGLVDLWRKRGAPDTCERHDGTFDCR